MPPARAQHVVLRPFPSASWLVVAGQGLLAAGLAVAVWVFLQLAPAQPAGAVLWWPVVAVLTLFLYRAWQGRRPRGWTGGVSTLVGDGAAAGLGFAAASMLWLVPLTFGLGLAEITVRLFIGEVNQRAWNSRSRRRRWVVDRIGPPGSLAAAWPCLGMPGAARLAGTRTRQPGLGARSVRTHAGRSCRPPSGTFHLTGSTPVPRVVPVRCVFCPARWSIRRSTAFPLPRGGR